MTEKRYSDGTLAKWYYSQTNVICDGNNEYYLRHKESVKDFNYNDLLGTNDLLDELNRLSDKNEQLKHDATVLIQANQDYRRENEQLKAQLYCPFDSICIQCTNEYLVQKEEYYVSKCKKGHEQCSKVDVKYCDDFELKGDME